MTAVAVILSIRLAILPAKGNNMFLFRGLRTVNNLLTVGILIFAATNALAASAPMPVSQLALYQGADRETVLVQGAKKEGQVVL